MYEKIIYVIMVLILLVVIYTSYKRLKMSGGVNTNEKVAIIYQTHYLSERLKKNILNIKGQVEGKYDFWLLYDNNKGDYDKNWATNNDINDYIYTKEDCLEHYSMKSYKPYSGIYNSPAKPIIPIFNKLQNYDYIWVLEYDVIYNGGNWMDIFNNYEGDGADVITYINDEEESLRWSNWKECNICDEKTKLQIFLPLIRYGKKMLNTIYRHLINGDTGHHEAFIGTLCNKYSKCKIKNIDNKFIGINYKYRPIVLYKHLKILEKNKLYHPVKEEREIYKN